SFRARRTRILTGESSIDEKAVWVLATTTGVLAALDEHTWPARAARVALPLVAAFLFERLIATERKAVEVATGAATRKKITWRVSPARVMVLLGLADAQGRDVADVDLTRRMARLATLAHRAHHTGGRQAKVRAERSYQAGLAKANERYGLSVNPRAMEQF